MKLYHYSAQKYDALLTKELQGVVTDGEREDDKAAARFRGDIGPYIQHVSFFIEPVPADILGSIFPRDHHTWAAGNVLYQYTVDVDDIDIYGWCIIENKINLIMDDMFWLDIDLYKKLFFTVRNIANSLAGNSGTTIVGLKKAGIKYMNTARDAFIALKKHKTFNEVKNLYAPRVPHVMVYTHKPIKIFDTTKIKIEAHAFECHVERYLLW
jgi:hypothetical protein